MYENKNKKWKERWLCSLFCIPFLANILVIPKKGNNMKAENGNTRVK